MTTKKLSLLGVSFAQAFVAMAGSLYFSEIRGFPPCILCWYQRIAMYPLVAILGVALYSDDENVPKYVLPLSIIGMGIAIYHNLLYYNVIPEAIAPCRLGISCTTQYISYFGFVTIPLLSLCAFTVITVCMVLMLKGRKQATKTPA
ncbi:MAG: disulfide oxidoreductase [Patescibacteria group bacterium]